VPCLHRSLRHRRRPHAGEREPGRARAAAAGRGATVTALFPERPARRGPAPAGEFGAELQAVGAQLAVALTRSPLLPRDVARRANVSMPRLEAILAGQCEDVTVTEVAALAAACGMRMSVRFEPTRQPF